MSTMAVSYQIRSNPAWIRKNVEIVRYSNGATLQCVTCGGPTLTQREFADIVGVPVSALQSFLHRGTARPDHMRKITESVARVRRHESH